MQDVKNYRAPRKFDWCKAAQAVTVGIAGIAVTSLLGTSIVQNMRNASADLAAYRDTAQNPIVGICHEPRTGERFDITVADMQNNIRGVERMRRGMNCNL